MVWKQSELNRVEWKAGCVRTIVVWKLDVWIFLFQELSMLRENHSGMETFKCSLNMHSFALRENHSGM